MAYVKNTMKLIESANSCIDDRYDMCSNNINDIYSNSSHPFDMICSAFKFGYMQGRKATISEMRKAVK